MNQWGAIPNAWSAARQPSPAGWLLQIQYARRCVCAHAALLDRGKEGPPVLPSLRTVRAVLPHTALQSVVSTSGLARSLGCLHGEQSQVCEECIGPALMIFSAVAGPRPLFMLAQHRPHPPSDESVNGGERVAVCMLEVLEPSLENWVEDFSDLAQALA